MHNHGSMRLFVGGSPFHCELIKENLLFLHDIVKIVEKIRDADLVYWISGPGPSIRNLPLLVQHKPKLLVHWIGTDVLKYNCWPRKYLLTVPRRLLRILHELKGVVHLAVSPWLDELESFGIRADLFPITSVDPARMSCDADGIARTIDFLSYVPLHRFGFYGGDKIIRLARHLPDTCFSLIVPDVTDVDERSLPPHPSNVAFIGKVPFSQMREFYLRSKCFLRLTEHDGLSLSILESMFYNLRVFWTYKFPHTVHVDKFDGLHQVLANVLLNWQPNEAGHNHVVNNYSVDIWRTNFRKLLLEITG